MHAADLIQAAIDRNRSIACVGLDPRPNLIPPTLVADALARHGDTAEAVADAFLTYNRGLIHAATNACAAVKLQLACYEAYGAAGMTCFADTVQYARDRNVPVIADGKRNDIGSTAEHYAQAYLGAAPGLSGKPLPGLGCDWLTVNPYLGADGITPFLDRHPSATGIFVLVRTSNASSGELQDLTLAGQPATTIAERVAKLVAGWASGRLGRSGLSSVGAVVGATHPGQARSLRALLPDCLFLVPGYGAQGGSAQDALAGLRPDGRGILVNSSRALLGAWQKPEYSGLNWKDAARAALEAMNKDLAAAGGVPPKAAEA
jgi:orotidine-5'-phosphate decarboxylase